MFAYSTCTRSTCTRALAATAIVVALGAWAGQRPDRWRATRHEVGDSIRMESVLVKCVN